MRHTMKQLSMLFLCLLIFGIAQADYPDKPVKWVVPYAVGGGADISSRVIAARMAGYLGQPIIIENHPGGNAVIGTRVIAKANPDGYTLGLVLSAHAVNPFVAKSLPYDPVKDFEPIAYVARMPGVMVVHPSVQANTLSDVVKLAKQHPKELFYAIPGGLTNGHVSMEMLKLEAAIDVTPVTFRGGAPATTEVVAGRIQMMILAPTAAMPFIQSGKLKAIATTGAIRPKALEKVPTFIESGFPGFETYEWFAMLAPAATPSVVIDKVFAALLFALKNEEVIKALEGAGLEIVGTGPQALKQHIEQEMGKMKKLTQTVKFQE